MKDHPPARLPPHWTTVELGRCGDWIGGRTPDKGNPAFWGGGLPWMSPKTMKVDVLEGSDDAVSETARLQSAISVVPAGSVVIVIRSNILRHSVPVAVTAVDCAINQDLRALVPARGIDPHFLAAQLRFRAEEILRVARRDGVTMASLRRAPLEAMSIAVPPLEEQIAITRRLEAVRTRIRSLHADLDEANHAISGVEGLAADRTKMTAETAHGTTRVADLLAGPIRTGLSVAGSAEPPGVPALKLSALREAVVDVTDVRYLPVRPELAEKFLLETGDVLVARGSGTRELVGRAAYVEGPIDDLIFPDTAYRIRLDERLMRPEWFVLIWNAPSSRTRLADAARTTAGIWKISTPLVAEARIPCPDLKTQEAASDRIMAIVAKAAEISAGIETARAALDSIEATTYERAMSGRLVAWTSAHPSSLTEQLMSRLPTKTKTISSRKQVMTTAEELRRRIDTWPSDGMSFAELRGLVVTRYEELRDAVFAELASGRLKQRFDDSKRAMVLHTADA